MTRSPSHKWYTDDLLAIKRRKRQAEDFWHKTGLHVHKEIFKSIQSDYYTKVKATKSEPFLGAIDEASGDPKALGRVLKTITRRDEVPVPLHTCKESLANRFANFFDDKVHGIRAELPVVIAPAVVSPPCTASLTTLDPVSEDKVSVVMRSSTKSCPLDPMPTWLLKDVLPTVIPLMTDFINASLLSGVVPGTMKRAAVTSLLKRPSLDADHLKN